MFHTKRNKIAIAAAAIAVFGGFCTLAGQRTLVAGETYRVSAVCLDCHDEQHAALAGSVHQILDPEVEGDEARITCTACHLGNEAHWEDDPEDNPMPSLADATPEMASQVCSTCHMNSHQQAMRERNVHYENDVACVDCHQVHGNSRESLLKNDETKLCLDCHVDVEAQFAMPYRHPVNDAIVKCTECHLSLDETRAELSRWNTNNPCYTCHREFQGPFPYEHQATVDYSTHEGSCLSCHEAHGARNPRLLKQPYEGPHFSLCSQCHSVPLHNFNSKHGTQWAGVPCNECHVDIHGSYTSRNFLSPSLDAQGCFVFACHQK